MQEVSNIAILPSTFHNLKYLDIYVPGEFVVPDYDYFSLVSFLDASPFLETFILDIYVSKFSYCNLQTYLMTSESTQVSCILLSLVANGV